MARWHFPEHDGYSDINQSSSAEAFEGTSTKGLATSLVRESVQNVLDVVLDTSEPARVRFTLVDIPASGDSCRRWFTELDRHLQHPEAGIPELPAPDEPCRYLLIEDFNTTGLVGDYKARYVPGTENNFVNFLYHDGLTGKGEKKLGSRGVGKIVLLLASRARTIFAYTVRSTDPNRQPLLVGKTLLRFRRVDDVLYQPAGYFVESWPQGQPRAPVNEPAELARFRKAFSLSRDNEPGLSVVIPFLDSSVTLDEIRRAVIEEYHFAILGKKLIVELSEGSTNERIDANQIPDLDDDLSARVSLATYALANPVPALQTIAPPAGRVQKLDDELVPESVRCAILAGLDQLQQVAVRCHLHVHPKDRDPVLTSCDVYFKAVEDGRDLRPVFVRELLSISGEGRPCSQLRALVLIPSGPLADILRAAEGANHTQWSPRTDNFKKAYKGRLGEIDFVITCVHRLIEIARGKSNDPVGGISTYFFSALVDNDGRKTRQRGKTKPGPKPQEPEIPESDLEPAGYLFSQEVSGFTLRGDPDQPAPKRITVRVAYDVIRGSPWSDYDPDDFDLRKKRGDIRIVANHAEIERPDPGNRLIVKPVSNEFEVVITGFSEQLDLIVEHRATDRTVVKKGKPDDREKA